MKAKMSSRTVKQNYPLTSKRTGYPTLFGKAGRMQAESEQQDCEAGPFFDVNFKAYWLSYCILFGGLANMNTHWKIATIPIFRKPALP